MDIARKDIAEQKRRRRIILSILGLFLLAGATLGLSRLKPAAPGVERSTVWTDTVKRGPLLRQVRGLGTLVPMEIRWIPAESDGRVERIIVLPGTPVKADTIIMELSNPQTEQEAQDAALQLRAAEADYKNTRVKLEGDLMTEKANAATVNSAYGDATRQASTDEQLAKLGVISGLTMKSSRGKAEELETRQKIEQERIEIDTKAIESQMAVQQAKVDQLRALVALKNKNLAALKVRAGINGILQEVPVEVGQKMTPGAILAKVAEPQKLKAELKIPETQAKDVQIGQPSSVDTHNGVITGTVMRVDPAVLNGTVTVDVKLEGDLPQGARPDLSVDGTIDLERLADVLYVGRPAFGQEKSTVEMFKVSPDGKTAERVKVSLGRSSVNSVEILGGLKEGEEVVLSDMSRWDNTERIRFE